LVIEGNHFFELERPMFDVKKEDTNVFKIQIQLITRVNALL